MTTYLEQGTLKDGTPYFLRQLKSEDLSAIMSLQKFVKEALEDTAVLEPLSMEEFDDILAGNGEMVGVFVCDTLIAFRAMRVPGEDPEHLGCDGGLSKAELGRVIYSEISCVQPAYRGYGLQTHMGRFLMKAIDADQYHYVAATVAPFNIASLKDKLRLEMKIVNLTEKYNGKSRYVLWKNLHYPSPLTTSAGGTLVNMADIEKQKNLLQQGCQGDGLQFTNGAWHVRYV